MARYKPYNYTQLRMIPVSLEQQLIPGTLEHTIHMVVEHEIDISIFDPQYNNDETGCRAYNPKSLLKVILMGYARGMLGSRKIEQACHENIVFMALACGQAPDHSTIAAFITTMKKEILFIFQRILLICDRMNLIDGTTFAIDGVKLPGNASKQMSGTFAELEEKKKKFQARVAKMIEKHIACDQESGFSDTEKRKLKKLNQSIQKIDRFLQENEPKPGKKKKENKSNITDNDSQLMMSSHGVIQGYNAQALVDSKHQIIIHADAGNSGQDDEHLSIMVEGAKENLKAIGKDEKILEEAIILGDPNYHSPANVKTCVEENLNAIFPNTQFRKTDSTKDPEQSTFTITDFTFNEQEDTRKLYIEWIPKYFGNDCEIQILSPMTRGSLGTLNINQMIQESINPPREGACQLKVGERIFRQGDRVIHRRNNYNLGVFNGDIGIIKEIDNQEL
ncbi:MAG: transposase, partial [bacterium]